MSLLLVGLNHRTAPVEVRERLAFSREGVATALMLFRSQFPNSEAAILSTCNRVEILVNSVNNEVTLAGLLSFLSQARDVPVTSFKPHLYCLEGLHVVRHLFRVISGLDSMVVGEYQIVNQLKNAYQLAHEQNTAGSVIHRLFHHAFGVSKRVRTETTIADGKTSIPSVAVDCIACAIPDFTHKRVLLVGAGEMCQLTAEYLKAAGVRDFAVTTRTLTNAKALADVVGGQAAAFGDLDSELTHADIVITATNCPMPILTLERIQRAQIYREYRPLLLIDLAVPRNISPDVAAIPSVRCHDVDGLGRIVEENARHRAAQLESCEKIIEEEVAGFEKWAAQSQVRPLIEQMYEDVRALAQIEVRGMFRKCPELSDPQKEAVQQLVDKIVAKLMHPCVSAVRQQASTESGRLLADAFHTIRISFDDRGTGAGLCPEAAIAQRA